MKCTLVPSDFFDATCAGDYLAQVVDLPRGADVRSELIGDYGAWLVWAQEGEREPLMLGILRDLPKCPDYNKILCSWESGELCLAIAQGRTLLLANTYQAADFVTAVYNPKSHSRYWQLYRLQELFLQERSADTPVGYVRQAGRPEQEVKLTTLGTLDPEDIDMFTVLIIGNSQSYVSDGHFITPRGYYSDSVLSGSAAEKKGQQIMMESFRTIASQLKVSSP